jgi:predicted DNA-binding transcriptional regulator AlpA
VRVEDGARALDISRASAYQAIADGTFPAKTIRVNRTLRVLTASLVAVLEGRNDSENAA